MQHWAWTVRDEAPDRLATQLGRMAAAVVKRLMCALTAHDWYSLAYPPARRWECMRCHQIIEDQPTEGLAI